MVNPTIPNIPIDAGSFFSYPLPMADNNESEIPTFYATKIESNEDPEFDGAD
jgi:hypothetical protein